MHGLHLQQVDITDMKTFNIPGKLFMRRKHIFGFEELTFVSLSDKGDLIQL